MTIPPSTRLRWLGYKSCSLRILIAIEALSDGGLTEPMSLAELGRKAGVIHRGTIAEAMKEIGGEIITVQESPRKARFGLACLHEERSKNERSLAGENVQKMNGIEDRSKNERSSGDENAQKMNVVSEHSGNEQPGPDKQPIDNVQKMNDVGKVRSEIERSGGEAADGTESLESFDPDDSDLRSKKTPGGVPPAALTIHGIDLTQSVDTILTALAGSPRDIWLEVLHAEKHQPPTRHSPRRTLVMAIESELDPVRKLTPEECEAGLALAQVIAEEAYGWTRAVNGGTKNRIMGSVKTLLLDLEADPPTPEVLRAAYRAYTRDGTKAPRDGVAIVGMVNQYRSNPNGSRKTGGNSAGQGTGGNGPAWHQQVSESLQRHTLVIDNGHGDAALPDLR